MERIWMLRIREARHRLTWHQVTETHSPYILFYETVWYVSKYTSTYKIFFVLIIIQNVVISQEYFTFLAFQPKNGSSTYHCEGKMGLNSNNIIMRKILVDNNISLLYRMWTRLIRLAGRPSTVQHSMADWAVFSFCSAGGLGWMRLIITEILQVWYTITYCQ